MSTSPETAHRADDRIVTLLSQWLARHVGDDELRREVESIGTAELSAGQAKAVDELLAELSSDRGQNEMLVRETLEALALGQPSQGSPGQVLVSDQRDESVTPAENAPPQSVRGSPVVSDTVTRGSQKTRRSSLRGVFTGIVRERGRLVSRDGGPEGIRLEVEAPQTAAGTGVGDSVALDGCCLTATGVTDGRIAFQAVPETIRRSTLAALAAGAELNVEPALRAGEPLGGHYVQGHVDGVGRVATIEPDGEGMRLRIEAPPEVLRYCVEKGSIAVQGVSLTIAASDDRGFEVALLPHTLAATTLGDLTPGAEVNLEADVLAKYVERLLPTG